MQAATAAPFKKIDRLPRDIAAGRRAGGCIVLRSRIPLQPYPPQLPPLRGAGRRWAALGGAGRRSAPATPGSRSVFFTGWAATSGCRRRPEPSAAGVIVIDRPAARGIQGYLPNTDFSRSVVRAAGLRRICCSSWPITWNRPSSAFSVT